MWGKRRHYRVRTRGRWQPRRARNSLSFKQIIIPSVLVGVFAGLAFHMGTIGAPTASADAGDSFGCFSPVVVDGDTLRCGSTRIRLQGIDAPEMPGHCREGRQCVSGDPFASTRHLRSLVAGRSIRCQRTDTDRYGRSVAICTAGQVNLSCEQLKAGHAVRRYASLSCISSFF